METAGFWNFLSKLGSDGNYAITLPNISVMVAGSLADAEYIRKKMRRAINRPAR